MKEGSNEPVRIIVKKKNRHSGGHHGGAWKVAYADFVTAMMALFIVLWIVGQSNAVKHAISAYFKDPGAFSEGTSSGGIHGGSSLPLPKPEGTQESRINNEMEKLRTESKRIEATIASVPALDKFKDKIQISVTRDGMKIDLIEDSRGLFFDVGSAKVKAETVQLIKLISTQVGKMENRVIVEGHTDARPYVSPGYSNWELSVDRANATRKLMEENGLNKDQVLEVRGYADRFLRQPDKPMDHSNRRVSIIVAIPKEAKATVPVTPMEGPALK